MFTATNMLTFYNVQDQSEVQFKVKMSTPMSKLKKSYAERQVDFYIAMCCKISASYMSLLLLSKKACAKFQ